MSEFNRSMPIREDQPLESEDKSSLIGNSSSTIKFSQDVMGLEIANNSDNDTIYLDISGTLATIATGIPIYAKQYYSADKKILKDVGICLISDNTSTDVRIIGHFHLDVEL
jgi:adenosylmethionine-8-amino-7-oxononanoate aminotransferase